METVLALDVGGTKLAAAVVDADGRVVARATCPTPRAPDGELVLAALLGVAREVRTGKEVAIGIGSGGPMTASREQVSPLNIPGWRDFPLRRRLADELGLGVHLDNDAKALALAEGWQGAARGVTSFLAMVVSTGVGGGIVLGGRLLDGATGNAGHIGHVIVEPAGRLCACGSHGCLEAEASGSAIAARTGHPARQAPSEERRRAGHLVGRAVASAAALLDLRLAVVAGSVALGFGNDFFAAAQEELDRSARISFTRGIEIRPAGLADEGPLVGAAAVAWRALGRPVLASGT
jgi:glucokinase